MSVILDHQKVIDRRTSLQLQKEDHINSLDYFVIERLINLPNLKINYEQVAGFLEAHAEEIFLKFQ